MSFRNSFRSLQLLREEIVFTATVFGSLSDYSVDAAVLQEIDPSPREVFRDALTLENATQKDLVDFIDSLRIRTCRGDYLLTHDALADLYEHARLVWEEGQARSNARTLDPADAEPLQHHAFAQEARVHGEGYISLRPAALSEQQLPILEPHDSTHLKGEAEQVAPGLQRKEVLLSSQTWENDAEQDAVWARSTGAATGAVYIRPPPLACQELESEAPTAGHLRSDNGADEAMPAPGNAAESCQPPNDQDEGTPAYIDYEEDSPAVPQMLARESFSAPRYVSSLADEEAAPRLQASGAITPRPTGLSCDALSAAQDAASPNSIVCATESVCTPPDLNPNQARARLTPSAPPPSPAEGAFCPIPPVPKADKRERVPEAARVSSQNVATGTKPLFRRSSTTPSASYLPACSAPVSFTAVTMHQKRPTPPHSGSIVADSDASKSRPPSITIPSSEGGATPMPSPNVSAHQFKASQGHSVGPLTAAALTLPASTPSKGPSGGELCASATSEFMSMSRQSSSQVQTGLRSWDATIEDAAGSASELVQQEMLRQASAGSGRSMLVVSEAFCKAARNSRASSHELSHTASKYATSQRRTVSDGKLMEAREDATDKERVVHGASNIMSIMSQQSPAHSAASDTLMQSSKVDEAVPDSLNASLTSSTALLVEASSQSAEPGGRTWYMPDESTTGGCAAVSKGLESAAHRVVISGVSTVSAANQTQDDQDVSAARRDYKRDADSRSSSSSGAEKRVSSASRAAATSGYKGVESPSTGQSTSALFSEGDPDHRVERRVSNSTHSSASRSQNDRDEYVMVAKQEYSNSGAALDAKNTVAASSSDSKDHLVGGIRGAADRSFTFAPAITFPTETGTYPSSEASTDVLSNAHTASYTQHCTTVAYSAGSSSKHASQRNSSAAADAIVSDAHMHDMHAYASPESREALASPSPEVHEAEGPVVVCEPQVGPDGDGPLGMLQPESEASKAREPHGNANDQEASIEAAAGESLQITHAEECSSAPEVHTEPSLQAALHEDSADRSHGIHDMNALHDESEEACAGAPCTEVQVAREKIEADQRHGQSKVVFTAQSKDADTLNDTTASSIEQRLAPLFSTRFFASGQSPSSSQPPSRVDREALGSMQISAGHYLVEKQGKRHPEYTFPEIICEQSACKKPREAQHSPDCEGVPSILTQTASTASGVVIHAVHSVGSERTCAIIERQSAPQGAAPVAISPAAAAAAATQLCSTLEDPVLGGPQGCSPLSNVSTVMNEELQQEKNGEEGGVSAATQDTDAADGTWILVHEHSGSGRSSPRSKHKHYDVAANSAGHMDAPEATWEQIAPEATSPDGSVFITPADSAAASGSPDGTHFLQADAANSDNVAHASATEPYITASETVQAPAAAPGEADDAYVPKLVAECSGSTSEASRLSQSVVHERDGVPAAPWAGTVGATYSDELGGSTLRWNARVSSQDDPAHVQQPQSNGAHLLAGFDRPDCPPAREPEPFFSASLLEQKPREDDVIEYVIDDSSRQNSAAIGGEAVEPVVVDNKLSGVNEKPAHRWGNSLNSAKGSSRARGGLRGAAAFYRAMTSYDSDDTPRSTTSGPGLFTSDTLTTGELEPSTELQDATVAAASNRLVSCGSPTNPLASMSAQPTTQTADERAGVSSTADPSHTPLARKALCEAPHVAAAPRSHLVGASSHAWENDLEASDAYPRAPVSATCYEVSAGVQGDKSQGHEAVETTALDLDPGAASQAIAPASGKAAAVDSTALAPVPPSRLSVADSSAMDVAIETVRAVEPPNEAVPGKVEQPSLQQTEPALHTEPEHLQQDVVAESTRGSQSAQEADTSMHVTQDGDLQVPQLMSPSAELEALDTALQEDADADAQAALDSLEHHSRTGMVADSSADIICDSAAVSEQPSADALLASLETLSNQIAAASASLEGSKHGEGSKDAQDAESASATEATSQYRPAQASGGHVVATSSNVSAGQAAVSAVGMENPAAGTNAGMGSLQPLMQPFAPVPRPSAPYEPAVQFINFAVPPTSGLPLAPQAFAPAFAAPAMMWPAVGPQGQAMPAPSMPSTSQLPARISSPPVAVPLLSASRGASPVRSTGMLAQKYQAARSSSAGPRARPASDAAPARGQPHSSLLNVDPAPNSSKSHSSPLCKRTSPVSSRKTATVSPKPAGGRRAGSLRQGSKAVLDASKADAVLSAANAGACFGIKRSASAVQQERRPQRAISSSSRLAGAAGSRSQSPPAQATAEHVHTAVGAPKKSTKSHHVTTASAANAAAGASAIRAKSQLPSQTLPISGGASGAQMQDSVLPGTGTLGAGVPSGHMGSAVGGTQMAGADTQPRFCTHALPQPQLRMSTQEDSLLTQQLQLQELSAKATVHAAAALRHPRASATSAASSSNFTAPSVPSAHPSAAAAADRNPAGASETPEHTAATAVEDLKDSTATYTSESTQLGASMKPAGQSSAPQQVHKFECEQQHSDAGPSKAVAAREVSHAVGNSVRGHSAGQGTFYPTSGSPASRKDDTSIELPLGALSGTELPGSDSPVAAKQVRDSAAIAGAPNSGGHDSTSHQILLPRLKCGYLQASNSQRASTEEASPSAQACESPLCVEHSELTPVNTGAHQSDQTPITTPASSVLATLATSMAPVRSAVEQSPKAESGTGSAESPVNCYERVNKQLAEGIKSNLISSECGAPTSVSAGLGSLATPTVATSELVDSMILDASGTGLHPPYSTGSDLHGYSQYPVDSEYWQSQYMKEPEEAGGLARDALREGPVDTMRHHNGPEQLSFSAHYSGPQSGGPVSVTAQELANGNLQASSMPQGHDYDHTASEGKAGLGEKPVSTLSQFLEAQSGEVGRYREPHSSSFCPESGFGEHGSAARLRHEASSQRYEATFTPQDDEEEDEEDGMSSSGTPVPCSPLKASASEGADSASTRTPIVPSSLDAPLSHNSSKHRSGAAAAGASARTPNHVLEPGANDESDASQPQLNLETSKHSSEGVSEAVSDSGAADQVKASGPATLVQEDFPPDSPEAVHASPDTSHHATSPYATSPHAPASAAAPVTARGYDEDTNMGDETFTRFRPARMRLMQSRDPYEGSESFCALSKTASSPDGCSAAQHYSSTAKRNARMHAMHAQSQDSVSATAGRAASALASSSFRSYAPAAAKPSKKFSMATPTCAADVVYTSYPALPTNAAARARGSSPHASHEYYNRDVRASPRVQRSEQRNVKARGHLSRTVSKHCRNRSPDEAIESATGNSNNTAPSRRDSLAVRSSAACTEISERSEMHQKVQQGSGGGTSAATSSPSAAQSAGQKSPHEGDELSPRNSEGASMRRSEGIEQQPKHSKEAMRAVASGSDGHGEPVSRGITGEGRSRTSKRQPSPDMPRTTSRTAGRNAANTEAPELDDSLPRASHNPSQQNQYPQPRVETRAIKKGQKLALSAYRNCNKFPFDARPNNPMRNTFPSRSLWPPKSDSEFGGDKPVQLNAITDVLPQAAPLEEPVPAPVRRASGGSGSSALLAHARERIIRAGDTIESNTRESNTRESNTRVSNASAELNAAPAVDSRRRQSVEAHVSEAQAEGVRRRPEAAAGMSQGEQRSTENVHRSKSRSKATHRTNRVLPGAEMLRNATKDWADSCLYSPTGNSRAFEPELPQAAVQASSSGRILSQKSCKRHNEAQYVPSEPEIQPASPRRGHGFSGSRVERAAVGSRPGRRPSPPGRRAAVGLRSPDRAPIAAGNAGARGARRTKQEAGR